MKLLNSVTIAKCHHVRNIGTMLNSTMKMKVQVNRVSQTAWFHLYSITKFRWYLAKEQTQSAIHAYVASRLDKNKSLLHGAPGTLFRKLQNIQNAAVKLILQDKKTEHQMHELPKELHWLPFNQRHIFKTLLLVHKFLKSKSTKNLKEMLPSKPDPRPLRSSLERLFNISRTSCIAYLARASCIFRSRKWNALLFDIRSYTFIGGFKKSSQKPTSLI